MTIDNSYRCSLQLFLISLALTLILSTPAFSQADESRHTVRPGETLYSISQMYQVTVTELREWNDLEPQNLKVGMSLYVSPPEPSGSITHTVQAEETLFSVSRAYGVSIAEIQQWNELESSILSVGQQLTIHREGSSTEEPSREEAVPEPSRESIVQPSSLPNTYYTVKSGDYLNKISREHDMTTEELRRLNNLEEDVLRVGQRLIVREHRSTPVVDEQLLDSTPQGRFVNYRLESGDTLQALLERFSMSEGELEALNPGKDIQSIRSGGTLTILLPATTRRENPYQSSSGLQDLGEMVVSLYDEGETTSPTSSGELYNPTDLTGAHANISLGSIVYLENPSNGKGSYVKINDRFSGEGIKLSQKVYDLLDFDRSDRQPRVVLYQED